MEQNKFLVAAGLRPPQFHESEESCIITNRIEDIVCRLAIAICRKDKENICIRMISRTASNAFTDEDTGAILLGTSIRARYLNARNSLSFTRTVGVMEVVHRLLLSGRIISQRELYYMLIESFESQNQLNEIVLDVSAALGAPRYALNIGAATRGVLGGCLKLAIAGSMDYVDCEYVGCNGWPIPGDINVATSVVVSSTARYILVIEKFGIFSRLMQDRIFASLPCVMVCGKGFPSIATRAMVSLLESRLRLLVLGVADYNPYGFALLQCYKRGSIRSSIEGASFVCNMRWLGLRGSQIRRHSHLGYAGEGLTARDMGVLSGLLKDNMRIGDNDQVRAELEEMTTLGKYELQWLYGHPDGTRFLQTFVLNAILRADYL